MSQHSVTVTFNGPHDFVDDIDFADFMQSVIKDGAHPSMATNITVATDQQ